jgi:hypothetical protein
MRRNRFIRLVEVGIVSVAAVLLAILLFVPGTLAQIGAFTAELNVTGVTINPQTKEVTVTGTVVCSEPAQFANLFVEVSQTGGQGQGTHGTAYGYLDECGPFSLTLLAAEGSFHPGRAQVTASVFACTETSLYPYPSSTPTATPSVTPNSNPSSTPNPNPYPQPSVTATSYPYPDPDPDPDPYPYPSPGPNPSPYPYPGPGNGCDTDTVTVTVIIKPSR